MSIPLFNGKQYNPLPGSGQDKLNQYGYDMEPLKSGTTIRIDPVSYRSDSKSSDGYPARRKKSIVQNLGIQWTNSKLQHQTKILGPILRRLFVMLIVAAPLSVIVALKSSKLNFSIDARYLIEDDNVTFYFTLWALITWLGGCAMYIITMIFPYVFRTVTTFVNPAWRRYWTCFRPLVWPLTLVGAIASCYAAFYTLLATNGFIVIDDAWWDAFYNTTAGQQWWDTHGNASISSTKGSHDIDKRYSLRDTCAYISDVMLDAVLLIAAILIIRIVVIYITIHVHYRCANGRLEPNKQLHGALSRLYTVSTKFYPEYCREFEADDILIHTPSAGHVKRKMAAKILGKIGRFGDDVIGSLGTVLGSNSDSHWFAAGSAYAVVEHALTDPRSCKALARRLWISLVCKGHHSLEQSDIIEVLGALREAEAKEIFAILDQNENGNIRLDEFINMVVEAGAVRQDIYSGIADMNHAINSFQWVAYMVVCGLMVFFILFTWVPKIRAFQQNLSFLAVGFSIVLQRSVQEFTQGSLFVFFKNPFWIGDTVRIYNGTDMVCVTGKVKRISLFYVILVRADDGTDIQYSNDVLINRRIENMSRSGVGREDIRFHVDKTTSFQDIETLKAELNAFVRLPDNCRDYKSDVILRLTKIDDLKALEMQVVVTHKSNWSNGAVKAGRSSKFLAGLVDICRRIPIYHPGGALAMSGTEGQPKYVVSITEEEAIRKREDDKFERRRRRYDYVEEKEEAPPRGSPGMRASLAELDGDRQKEIEAQLEARRVEDERRAMKAQRDQAEQEREDAARWAFMGVKRSPKPEPVVKDGNDVAQALAKGKIKFESPFTSAAQPPQRPARPQEPPSKAASTATRGSGPNNAGLVSRYSVRGPVTNATRQSTPPLPKKRVMGGHEAESSNEEEKGEAAESDERHADLGERRHGDVHLGPFSYGGHASHDYALDIETQHYHDIGHHGQGHAQDYDSSRDGGYNSHF